MYFNYDNVNFRYEPFPIGLATPFLDRDMYREMLAQYPEVGLFRSLPEFGRKYSLSEKYNRDNYRKYIASHPLWKEFYDYVKSDAFIYGTLGMLANHHIDLGYGSRPLSGMERLAKALKAFSAGRMARRAMRLHSRFEFSMLPADGGAVLPHVDNEDKIVTLVISILNEGEWRPEYGGGTDVNRARQIDFQYNKTNRQADFDDMEVLDTFEFLPNQAVIFTPTFNSWHSVRPLTGPGGGLMRKTLTLVIESGT